MTLGAASSTGNAVVTLDKSEIRQRARRFAAAWAGTTSEHADKQPFWDAFFQVFGIERRQVAIYERIAQRASTGRKGWLDLLVPGEMGVEQKSAGKSLDTAMDQLIDYLPSLPQAEHPWLLIVSDFSHFKWHNLESGASGTFALQDLPDHLELFWWLAGYQVPHRDYGDEVAANLTATQLLADVYDALVSSGYPTGDSREWITRLLFCLFADDAGVWDRRAFQSYLALHTAPDGHDLGDVIGRIYRVLNTAPDDRPGNLDEDLRQFTYINGDLFARDLWPVTGNAEVRRAILEACSFDWSIISPAIFGSLFQNVMSPKERRQLGAHYTTERDILRTIRPLFLDELEAELESTSTLPKLRAFHSKLANLKFFDPACGCGNFLVISYREIRRLETICLRKIAEKERRTLAGQRAADLSLLCKVTVDHFYGIELEEFPARIARTALYLMDHLENRRVSIEFGEHFMRFPIPATVNISIGNALREDWHSVLPSSECDYVFGNPPFAGQKTRAADQTADLKHVWGNSYSRWLDYVTGWYRLAADYIADTHARAAFVSTNSITQGEQIARVWRFMLNKGMKIDFAHRTFKWISEARGKAIVHVVIVGFSSRERQTRTVIYDYPRSSEEPVVEQVPHINPYLLAAPDILVEAANSPLSPSLPPVQYGNKPSDGGYLIVEETDKPANDDPATKYLRPYLGARELLHGEQRWCIWMEAPDADTVRRSPWLRNRLAAVQKFRQDSSAADTRKQAATPWRFFRTPQPQTPYIAIPRHVSHTRRWFTVAFEEPQVIASDALFTASDPDGLLFAVLSSGMFTAWLGSVGGRIKSDFRFSGAVVYNTFPLPELTDRQRGDIIAAGREVIAARESHLDVPLADLYDPLSTPPNIQTAHQTLDRVMDRIFAPRSRPSSVTDRMNILFPAYEALVGHLVKAEPIGRRRRAART
ncbi:class I SAM-dependent DNA methyltransferase [Streptomyces misionensis]|uniref:site-specific DNA-methyltransferase (adenine-specific) n=1 Tax=Streptomyces misionensis TaxID=67331 RepID=A0A5C6IYD2_9ACTN|nr:DNA methyltransferase [Streptomyces misionensis]TWV34208.1 class I SAM-dependent DNA methyltransferase [Streptomyces misionensis]